MTVFFWNVREKSDFFIADFYELGDLKDLIKKNFHTPVSVIRIMVENVADRVKNHK